MLASLIGGTMLVAYGVKELFGLKSKKKNVEHIEGESVLAENQECEAATEEINSDEVE